MPKAIVHTATGEFRDEQGRVLYEPDAQGWREAGAPPSPDPAFSRVDIPRRPDPRTERWSGSAIVAKTQADIDSYDAAATSRRNLGTSRQKDILATCALVVRSRGIAAWNAMSPQQKRDATIAEADVWANMRDFFEANVQ